MREDVDGPEHEPEEGSIELADHIGAVRSALARGNAEDLIREITPILDAGAQELEEWQGNASVDLNKRCSQVGLHHSGWPPLV